MITLDDALANGRGMERPFNCPVHEDRNASASVNISTGLWYCFACGSKGDAEGYVPDARSILQRLEEMDIPPRVYPKSWLSMFDAHHPSPYWAERFGEKVARAYRCGTDPQTGLPTYPMLSRTGEVWGVVARAPIDPKYMYPTGVQTSKTMFLTHTVKKADVLVVVEGAADVMALAQSGLPRSWRAGGTYGAGLHAFQRDLVLDMAPKLVVLAFDGDKAGQIATEAAAAWCTDTGIQFVSHPWDSFGVKDPGDMQVDLRIHALVTTLTENGYERYAA